MQLTPAGSGSPLRARLSAAACTLLAGGTAGAAHADPAKSLLDATLLGYGENQRARVVEPTVRYSHLYADGQSLSAQFALDVITGASPSGAMPSGREQTVTSASGNTSTVSGDVIPTTAFKDTRAALDAEWVKPIGLLTPTLGGHYSREKDYQSLGANAKLSLELMHRLTTVTVGAGINDDSVFPVGGITPGLVPVVVTPPRGDDDGGGGGSTTGVVSSSKRVTSGLIGLSRVITRRWLMGINASRTFEKGYLTEPYKVVSLIDPGTGYTTGELTELRPSTRRRSSVLASSVYHFTDDVFYVSYRYYWDDWNVRSNTIDLKYRRELQNDNYFEPHLRLYSQTAASFFGFGLIQGAPLPEYATSDYRLGKMTSFTIGATYGFRITDQPGEWTIRGEFMGQMGDGHPPDAVGVQQSFDLFPTVSIGSVVVGYTVEF